MLGIRSFRPFPLAAVRAALQGAKRVVVLEKSFSVGLGGMVSTDVRLALSGLQLHGYTVVAGLGGRAITKASLVRTLTEAVADKLQPLTFLDLDWGIVNRHLEREKRHAPQRPDRREPAARRGRRRGQGALRRHDMNCSPSSSTRPAPSPSATACWRPSSAACRPRSSAPTRSTRGHRACQGCGEALGARYAVDAAMRATDKQLIAANATGCLEVFSTPYPETSWQMPWIHSLFGNAAAVATGIAAALQGARARRATCASSPRAATAAPPTSASAACRACSSATTTCSTSATTTRPT